MKRSRRLFLQELNNLELNARVKFLANDLMTMTVLIVG